jgi:ATP phosphoribosyltransferase regulatory subunit
MPFPCLTDGKVNDRPLIEAPLPKGVSDFLPAQAAKIGYIEEKIRSVFELWGFRRIITPFLEFQDVLSIGMGEELREKTFRFDDRQTGKLLALPPDITPQVARIVATRMRTFPLPHRLYYNGRVLRHAESQSGRSRELFQSGVELIGLDSPEADAEMVAMSIQVLRELGLTRFKIDLGQVEFFRGIMADSGLPAPVQARLQEAVGKKDVSAAAAILDEQGVAGEARERILALPRLFGGREILVAAAAVAGNERSRKALANITEVVRILEMHGVADCLTIDLGEIRGLDYHTGLTFEGFVEGVGEPVCGGGRYDGLMGKYGFPAPSTGFAFNVLVLLSALDRRPDVEASVETDFLIFNLKSDRGDALEIARHLRSRGFTVARDIIRRDFNESLAYARKMNIRKMIIVGEGDPKGIVLVRVQDGTRVAVPQLDIFKDDFNPQYD